MSQNIFSRNFSAHENGFILAKKNSEKTFFCSPTLKFDFRKSFEKLKCFSKLKINHLVFSQDFKACEKVLYLKQVDKMVEVRRVDFKLNFNF
jgi:hypothetical protein